MIFVEPALKPYLLNKNPTSYPPNIQQNIHQYRNDTPNHQKKIFTQNLCEILWFAFAMFLFLLFFSFARVVMCVESLCDFCNSIWALLVLLVHFNRCLLILCFLFILLGVWTFCVCLFVFRIKLFAFSLDISTIQKPQDRINSWEHYAFSLTVTHNLRLLHINNIINKIDLVTKFYINL